MEIAMVEERAKGEAVSSVLRVIHNNHKLAGVHTFYYK